MKKIHLPAILTIIVLFMIAPTLQADEAEYPAYYRITSIDAEMEDLAQKVKSALELKGFNIIGEYHPAEKEKLYVITFTRDDLAGISLKFKDRGALASVLKVGLVEKEGKIDLSMLNPMYLFYAYLLEGIDPYEEELGRISDDVSEALKEFGSEFEAFGGAQTKEDLQDYRYKIMMPYFTDPEDLNEFESFDQGLDRIRKNLEAGKGNTIKVYEVVYPDDEVAVFGVGLLDSEDGEARFLPIIGEDHVCAMPYEMILQGNELTMLPGRYRIALHWPELTMGTFMKIMSTPGKIEDFLEALSEE